MYMFYVYSVVSNRSGETIMAFQSSGCSEKRYHSVPHIYGLRQVRAAQAEDPFPEMCTCHPGPAKARIMSIRARPRASLGPTDEPTVDDIFPALPY